MKKKKNKSLKPGIRAIIDRLSHYKKELFFVSLTSIFAALTSGVTPYIAGRLFDSIISPSEITIYNKILPTPFFFLIIWLVIQFLMHVLDWHNNRQSKTIGMKAWTDYISGGFSHLLKVPISYHKTNKLGEIQEKIQRAANSVDVIASNIVVTLAPEFLSIFVAFIIAFYVNFVLAFILLAGVLLYAFIMIRIVSPMNEMQRKRNKAFREAWGLSFDALGNVQAVKQAVTEDYEGKKIMNLFKGKVFKAWTTVFNIWENLSFSQRIIILITQFAIYVISINGIISGNMSIGELVMFNGYAAMVFGPFVTLGRNWQTVQTGIIAVEQGQKIFDHKTEPYNEDLFKKDEEFRGTVEFKDVFFKYTSGKNVLEEINFKVEAGTTVALVGESGVGKSTLIDLISGYYFPNKGRVLIDGIPTSKHNLKRLRSNIGLVSQEIVLFNDDILKNIKYGNPKATMEEVELAAKKAHVTNFIEKFPKKWKQVVGERGIKLSVGQKQRLAIARAILQNPNILILDEPTSALDARSEKLIQESLEELMKGKTTFIIAHRLSTVRQADQILVFANGRIVERGNHEELMQVQNGEYRKLYELQIGLHD